MQFQRIMLFTALGLVLVMLWQSWIEFQQKHNNEQSQAYTEQSDLAQSKTSSGNITEDVPAVPAISVNTNNTQIDNTVEQNNTQTRGQLITVTTDLLNIEIDTHGGDIVRAELRQHPVSVDTPNTPFVLMHRNNLDLYVAQSGLIGKGREYPNHNTLFSTPQTSYQLGGDEKLQVVLNWTSADGIDYQKVFKFSRDRYRVDIEFRIDNQSDEAWTGFVYGQLKQTEIVQESSMGFLGRLPSYNGPVIYTEAEKYEKVDYSDVAQSPLNVITPNGWVAMLQHYFVGAWLPQNSQNYQLYSSVSKNTAKPQYRIGYKSTQPVNIEAGDQGVIETALYVGPKEQRRLEQQNAPGLKLVVDYGWLTIVANPLFWLLSNIYGVVQNWGWAIILLTCLVKLVFYPLSAASYKSMAKMKKLQPRMATLKERYSEDKSKFQQEMMKLYKSEKVNPAGGCFPILIQIPVFIALYWVLLESVELRQADFIFWLNDLSLPDPFYVLPIIMGASMIAQHFLNPSPVDPLQKKIMMALPFVFTIFFLWFPAGLVLYWVVNNLLSISQQYYISRKYSDD